jgi:uncharacterized cupredoxin-like copper-binding protein
MNGPARVRVTWNTWDHGWAVHRVTKQIRQHRVAPGIDRGLTMGTATRRFVTPLAVAVIALLIGACGSGRSTAGGTSGNPPAATQSLAGLNVTATETEYSITLSTSSFTAGQYTFVVANHGTMSHNLNIAGPGLAQQSSSTVQPGGSGTVTVTLQKGTYELWCSIDGHKDLGMDLKIQVT